MTISMIGNTSVWTISIQDAMQSWKMETLRSPRMIFARALTIMFQINRLLHYLSIYAWCQGRWTWQMQREEKMIFSQCDFLMVQLMGLFDEPPVSL